MGLFMVPLVSDEVFGTLLCLIPVAVGYAFVAPSMQVLLARYSSSMKRTETFMYGSIASLLGMFLGPICFAALHQVDKKFPLKTPFFVCGSVTVIAMMLMVAIIQENAMLPEHKEHEDEPNYELLQVVKLGKMIGGSKAHVLHCNFVKLLFDLSYICRNSIPMCSDGIWHIFIDNSVGCVQWRFISSLCGTCSFLYIVLSLGVFSWFGCFSSLCGWFGCNQCKRSRKP
jgi:MFS family permease